MGKDVNFRGDAEGGAHAWEHGIGREVEGAVHVKNDGTEGASGGGVSRTERLAEREVGDVGGDVGWDCHRVISDQGGFGSRL